ncbi:uncharacterized protein [Argopecten irradians]|uniref:uncharacterized protein n=1 Tax=Argopecten irradians TaxID=31199 RepID=UPI003722F0C3
MDPSTKYAYPGQGARPKAIRTTNQMSGNVVIASTNISDEIVSDDCNSCISDDENQSKNNKVKNELCQKVKVHQYEGGCCQKLKSKQGNNTSSEVKVDSLKDHHSMDSAYGDWVIPDLEVKGGKHQQMTEPEDLKYDVKVQELEVKGPVIDSGFEDVDGGIFHPRTNNSDLHSKKILESDEFLQGINDVCQNKHFNDHEQFLLKKWRESGLKLWKILHEREECSRKRHKSSAKSSESELEMCSDKNCGSLPSCQNNVDSKMCRLEELAYKQAINNSRLVSEKQGEEHPLNSSSSINLEEKASDVTPKSQPEFWTLTDKAHILNSKDDNSNRKSRFMENFIAQSHKETVKSSPVLTAKECKTNAKPRSGLELNDNVEVPAFKEENNLNHKHKSSGLEPFNMNSKLWDDSVTAVSNKSLENKHSPVKSRNFPHIPFFCSGPNSCYSDVLWREEGVDLNNRPSKFIQGQNSVTEHSIQETAKSVKVGIPVMDSVHQENPLKKPETNPSHMRRWSNIVGGDDIRCEHDQVKDEEKLRKTGDSELEENLKPIHQTSVWSDDSAPPLIGPSNSQCNFKEHLLKSLDQHKSPTFSSDSATTDLDRSSTNDWADADSSDVNIPTDDLHGQNKRNSCPNTGYSRDACMSKSCAKYSPKRYRKKTHSRSRSMEHEVVMDLIRNRVMTGNGFDSDSTEESLVDMKTALRDQGHQNACKGQTSHAEVSQPFHHHETVIPDLTENYTVESCSESSHSADNHCYSGCGPATGILGLRYAIPYLSERLKMSLAKRIESGSSGKQIPRKPHQRKSEEDIKVLEAGIQSDPGCSTQAEQVLNDLDHCGECSMKSVEHGLCRNVSNLSDTNVLPVVDREELISKLWGIDTAKSTSQHSNISDSIPSKFQGPFYLGQGHAVVKDRYLKGKCVCPVSTDECSHDEISQTDESEGLEISHSFQYIDISDGEMDSFSHSQLQTDLLTESKSPCQVLMSGFSGVLYDDIDKPQINLPTNSCLSHQSSEPNGKNLQPTQNPNETTIQQSNPISLLGYPPCVELLQPSHLPCSTDLSETLSQISYVPCEEVSESLKLIGQGEDTENCSCAETGFLSTDGIDLDDVEESRADLQFLSIEQDTSDCSSIHTDTDRSNLSEELPVRSLFSTHSESDSGEADDEFECECEHCLQLRSRNDSTLRSQGQGHTHPSSSDLSVVEDEAQGHQRLPDGELEEGLYRISIAELSPLSSIMNSRRNELEFMFENVILQMLAVHPDLLSDATPPPADQAVIEALPSLPVNQGHLTISLSCPICLCVCEEKEILSCLPCQHLFHQLCIQAWLIKSGTCPVCRRTL